MTVDCITLDQLESRAATSVALAIYARRVREGIVSFTVGKPLVKFLNFRLDQLVHSLRIGALNNCPPEQMREFSSLLKNLNICLLRLAEDSDLRSHRFMKEDLEKISDYVDDFESILENIYLALDPGFHGAVSSAIDQLNLGVVERATMSR